MSQETTVVKNSREWWDRYFRERWEANEGRNQTRGFMSNMLIHLPEAELAFLVSSDRSILDWGCALGDGTKILSDVCPNAHVSGLDFSSQALQAASAAYPDIEFLHTPDGAIPRPFDVIITSNCLEHFDRPLDIVSQHLNSCHQLYIALVPYEEDPLLDQHQVRFNDDTFPKLLSGFRRLSTTIVNMPWMYWDGPQLLVVYASGAYLKQRNDGELAPSEKAAVSLLRSQVLLGEHDRLVAFARSWHTKSEELWDVIRQRDAQVRDLSADVLAHAERLGEADHRLQEAQRKADRRLQEARREADERERELVRQSQELKRESRHLASQLETAQLERDRFLRDLNMYYASRAWRWSMRYWELRTSTCRVASTLVKAIYHALVPRSIRLRIWERRHHNRSLSRPSLALVQALRHGSAILPHGAHPGGAEIEQRYRAQIRTIISDYADAKGVVVNLPSIEWELPLFQRPQQMSLAFARKGYLVLYWVHNGGPDAVEGFRKIGERIYLCNVPPSVMAEVPCPITFTYPYNSQWLRYLNSPTVIYDLIDDLEIFSEFKRKALEVAHKRLIADSNVVVGSADELVQAMRVTRSDAVLCPNGVDFERFHAAVEGNLETPADIVPILAEGKPIVGYYGALAKWFDHDLVRHSAESLQGCNFVLIGPSYDGSIEPSGLLELPNVHWLGPKDYQSLPAYLQYFDVATIPFKATSAMHSVSPLKLFEYMAGRRPIVTTDMAECRKYPVVLTARNADEYVKLVREALRLRDDAAYLNALEFTARENTWSSRVETIIRAVERPRTATEDDDIEEVLTALREDRLANEGAPARTFKEGVARHYSGLTSNHPMFETWVRYALGTNQRGHEAVRTIQKYTTIPGKRHLDIGCAYGGTPIAFARGGAHAIGIEIMPELAALGKLNAGEQKGLDIHIIEGDILGSDLPPELDQVDIITCENVVEHVESAQALLDKIGRMLTPTGICHLAIPNAFSYTEVHRDGHYGLFGLTLLDRSDAIQYFHLAGNQGAYGVGEYCFTYEQYCDRFNAAGLTLEHVNPLPADHASIEALKRDMAGLRDEFEQHCSHGTIPVEMRDLIRMRLDELLRSFQEAFTLYQKTDRATRADIGARLLRDYRLDTWYIVARPVASKMAGDRDVVPLGELESSPVPSPVSRLTHDTSAS